MQQIGRRAKLFDPGYELIPQPAGHTLLEINADHWKSFRSRPPADPHRPARRTHSLQGHAHRALVILKAHDRGETRGGIHRGPRARYPAGNASTEITIIWTPWPSLALPAMAPARPASASARHRHQHRPRPYSTAGETRTTTDHRGWAARPHMVNPSPDSQTHGDKTMPMMTPGQADVWRSIFAGHEGTDHGMSALIAHTATPTPTPAPRPRRRPLRGGLD